MSYMDTLTEQLRAEQLGDYAKDTVLNLSSVLAPQGAPGLEQAQIHGTALAVAYATRHPQVVRAVQEQGAEFLQDAHVRAAQLAATLMAMNNVYYRFVHLVQDDEYSQMPARLRMNGMANPGVEKVDFELYALAVSAINGCGMCMDAHVQTLHKAGVSKQAVQSVVRIAAVVQAFAQALYVAEHQEKWADAA